MPLNYLDRIKSNPLIMKGKPVIHGTRVTVESVLGLLAQGVSPTEVLDECPELQAEDVSACLLFAIQAVQQHQQPSLDTQNA